jgi:hypothetical protein
MKFHIVSGRRSEKEERNFHRERGHGDGQKRSPQELARCGMRIDRKRDPTMPPGFFTRRQRGSPLCSFFFPSVLASSRSPAFSPAGRGISRKHRPLDSTAASRYRSLPDRFSTIARKPPEFHADLIFLKSAHNNCALPYSHWGGTDLGDRKSPPQRRGRVLRFSGDIPAGSRALRYCRCTFFPAAR